MINVLEYGVSRDGVTDNTVVLQELLDSLQNTGGILCFPAGEYVTCSLRLYSNTTIYLEAGAVLKAGADKESYPIIGEDMIPGFVRGTRRGILFALNAENVTVKGEGRIDGCGYHWWQSGESDERRPRTIQFINVNNVTIEGIKICNSPCWTIHPIHCSNVNIHNVTINNPYKSPNTDGINPESCSNVRISDCYIDVGDDCITIKSGLERDTFPKSFPCENITVSNCTFVHGHGGIVIGSEMSGGVENVAVTNCIFRNTDRGIRIKTRRKRGGTVKDILVNNVIMDKVMAGITINEYYACGASPDDTELFSCEECPIGPDTPDIHNIIISNVIMKNVLGCGIYFLGLPERPVSGVKIMNVDIRVNGCEEGLKSVVSHHIAKSYGDGIYLKNAKDVQINGCSLEVKHQKIITEHVQSVYVNGKECL